MEVQCKFISLYFNSIIYNVQYISFFFSLKVLKKIDYKKGIYAKILFEILIKMVKNKKQAIACMTQLPVFINFTYLFCKISFTSSIVNSAASATFSIATPTLIKF